MNLIEKLINFFKIPKNGNNKLYDENEDFYDENEDLFNIKILKGKSAEKYYNIAYCNIYNHCMYIRKPSKKIDNYIDYSIDVINHEFMHYFLYRHFNESISSNFHNISYIVEFRKMITDRKIAKSLCYT